ncbi:MAG TPA: LLM class flavin-dependent oxidoreductase [Chloroflexia bacterium]|nr:LLM class flavin-dependent oxidoreductase [Chloroflexia bacterium]
MRVGIGLPATIPGTPGGLVLDWARRAEERGFSSLAVIDSIAFPSYDALSVLAAAAGATEHVGLLANVLVGPARNPVLLAKQAASIDRLSGGRLTLGVGVGSSEEDYALAEQPFHDRGKRWDAALETIHRVWRGEAVDGASGPIGPTPTNGESVPLLFGGMADEAIKRTVRRGAGWTAGAAGLQVVGPFAERVRQAWREAGREGEPRLVCLAYYALGPGAREGIEGYLRRYYDPGPYVEQVIRNTPSTPEAVREVFAGYRDAGFDEMIFNPTVASLEQVDMLADALLG